MWEELYQTKDNWKKNTFENIKNRLLSIKGNRFVRYDQTVSNHLVCVYGTSQVGKTTLILNMIGLKEEYKEDVSNVLRGGVKLGNSSTSTAIIYSKNDSDILEDSKKYGIRIETIDGQCKSSVSYYTSEEMIQQLKSIRDMVEQNQFCKTDILHIFIPKTYFDLNEISANISILDLPGIESRNSKERNHVNSLMTRYIPISSVCIIVRLANELATLDQMSFPNEIDWKNLPHKYLVVLTRSFSVSDSIKKYLKDSREESDLTNYAQQYYDKRIKDYLGKDNRTKLYPLELGESFETFLEANEEHREEVTKCRDNILHALQEEIMKHKGEQLLAVIKELYGIVNNVDQQKIDGYTNEKVKLEEKKKNFEKKLKEKKSLQEQLEQRKEELSGDAERIKKIQKDINTYSQEGIPNFIKDLKTTIESEISQKRLEKEKNGEIWFCDNYNERYILSTICQYLKDNLIIEISEDIPIDLNHDNVCYSIYNEFCQKYERKLYPPLEGFIERWRGYKITKKEALEYIQKIEDIIKQYIIKPHEKYIKSEIEKHKRELQLVKTKINQKNKKIADLQQKKEHYDADIKAKDLEISEASRQKECDEKTLKNYVEYAEEPYQNQRKDIYDKINLSTTSREEKLLNVLLLATLEKEYTSFKNAAYG